MTSKVDTPLKLSNDGMTVHVTGPIEWKPDEASAVFSVEIIQPRNGATVSARGESTRTYPKDKNWHAIARVNGPRRLELGPAGATATATIRLKNGKTDHYPWPNDVELVHKLPQRNDPREATQPITADG
jgi:hypothetical protein